MSEIIRGAARLPGLVDLQVNGWAGVDFSDPGLRPEDLARAAEGLLSHGVTAFLPTVVTGSEEDMRGALSALAGAVRAGGLAARTVAGIHLEGPFISALDGPRGAHPLAHVRLPDLDLAERLLEASEGLIRMLTFAPELPGADRLAAWCLRRGIVAALGHGAPEAEDIKRCADAGASLSTHLGNGCAALLPRHPNLIWEQLAEPRLAATMIADGHHLPDSVMRVFRMAKGEGLILVSDVTSLGGSPPGVYASRIGGRVRLDGNGRLSMADSPAFLAGAALPLLSGVLRFAERGMAGFSEAWEMASLRPGRLLGMEEPPGDVLWDSEGKTVLEARAGEERLWKA